VLWQWSGDPPRYTSLSLDGPDVTELATGTCVVVVSIDDGGVGSGQLQVVTG
jgi:hypothetical protein